MQQTCEKIISISKHVLYQAVFFLSHIYCLHFTTSRVAVFSGDVQLLVHNQGWNSKGVTRAVAPEPLQNANRTYRLYWVSYCLKIVKVNLNALVLRNKNTLLLGPPTNVNPPVYNVMVSPCQLIAIYGPLTLKHISFSITCTIAV